MSDNNVRPRDAKEREKRCRVCGGSHEYGKTPCNQWWLHRISRSTGRETSSHDA